MDIFNVQRTYSFDQESNEHHRQPARRKRCSKLFGLCIVLVLVFGLGFVVGVVYQGKPAPPADYPEAEDPGPRVGSLQQQINAQDPGIGNNLPETPTGGLVSDDLDYLKGLGLEFFLRASNSTCPDGVCRNCTTTVFKEMPKIDAEGECGHVERTINETCYLCGRQCYNFIEALNGMCRFTPTCADLTRMADLNKYCNEGYAVFDKDKTQSHSLAEHLRCICPHGKSGEHCENVADTGNVLCSCYKRRYKLQETLPEFLVPRCENASYSNDTRCLHFTERETCYCVSMGHSDKQILHTSCDIFDTNSDDDINSDSDTNSDDNANSDSGSDTNNTTVTTDGSLHRESRDANDASMRRQTNHACSYYVNSSIQLLVVSIILSGMLFLEVT